MGSAVLDEIRGLDPAREHQRIVLLSCRVDFPWDTTRALEFALFRTFAVPSISALLARTGEFERRPQKRYDDTDLLVSELMEWGYDSPRGQRALARMNAIHGRFAIGNDDFVYVLSTFIFEPIRWNERFGWRPMTETERLALFYFWCQVGRRMGMRNLPETIDACERFNREYEAAHYRYTDANRAVGTATRELFASWAPLPLRPLVRLAIHAMLDDRLREAFGFPRPPRLVQGAVASSLRFRGWLAQFGPPRRQPLLRTQMPHRTYPAGYQLEALGPEPLGEIA